MKRVICMMLSLCMLLCACGQKIPVELETVPPTEEPGSAGWKSRPVNVIDDSYRTYYEVFVYSFYDSDGDGIGDLKGVTAKLDYIQSLGFNGIWLMPIMPSPTYHKYDTTDYYAIDPEYGTLDDFRELLEACHSRGIRVIMDLALNHSSIDHPWYKEAEAYLKSLPKDTEPDTAECPYVEYYNFSRQGGAGYTNVNGSIDWYYECRFWGGMPDLNLESEAVRAEFEKIASFWLDMGVDGFRLDAVKEYITGSIQANVDVLNWFNSYVKSVNPDAYIVCECWEPKEIYAQYYESGVDSMFDFAFGDNSGVIAKVVKGNAPASYYGEQLAACQTLYRSYSETAIPAPFYTNHDMGRTAGYYAGDIGEAQTKIGNAMNILMSGTVFVYYGEELGMKGAGKDENKRVAMYWSEDPFAEGMCQGPAAADKVKMKFGSLESQISDENSVYSYVKNALLIRNQNPGISRGQVQHLPGCSSDQICSLIKVYEGGDLLLIFNISAESAQMDYSGVSLNGVPVSRLTIAGQLLTGEETVTIDGETVTMPAYSVLVLSNG